MEFLVNSQEMRMADCQTSEYFGVDSLVLMERAALSVAERIEDRFPNTAKILIVAGPGGNGGDGVCIGRILHLRGYQVSVKLVKKELECNEICQRQIKTAKAYGVPFIDTISDSYELIVDAMLGNGVNREISGTYQELIREIEKQNAYVIAVDIPTGINADDGKVLGMAVRADETVTFGFYKLGHMLYPGAGYCGNISLPEIGITKESFLRYTPKKFLLKDKDLSSLFHRKEDTNKGSYGKVLVIAGSKEMAGACIFSAKSALRTGCGMVKIFTCKENRDIVLQQIPEAMLSLYCGNENEAELEEKLKRELEWADSCVIGPGLSLCEFSKTLVRTLKELILASEQNKISFKCKSFVFDADAINLVARDNQLKQDLFHLSKHQIVFTPHIAELSRLMDCPVQDLKYRFLEFVTEYAKGKQATFVCKDARTLIIRDDYVFLNNTGNQALATAGSGDILAGMLAALLGQKNLLQEKPDMKNLPVELLISAVGVYLHGHLGQLGVKKRYIAGNLASDFIELIPEALERLHLYQSEADFTS